MNAINKDTGIGKIKKMDEILIILAACWFFIGIPVLIVGIIGWVILRMCKEEYYKRLEEREKILQRCLRRKKTLPKFSPNGEIARMFKRQRNKQIRQTVSNAISVTSAGTCAIICFIPVCIAVSGRDLWVFLSYFVCVVIGILALIAFWIYGQYSYMRSAKGQAINERKRRKALKNERRAKRFNLTVGDYKPKLLDHYLLEEFMRETNFSDEDRKEIEKSKRLKRFLCEFLRHEDWKERYHYGFSCRLTQAIIFGDPCIRGVISDIQRGKIRWELLRKLAQRNTDKPLMIRGVHYS
jgi:hypothetical protein